ncbi:hypothetical protein GX563_07600 [Candidatus Bathyarchaeota archaeon]|nr:hypothetical protein [Candidatus Bathyarchaeota archaeon]
MLCCVITCFAAATTYAPVSSGGGPMYGGHRDDAGYSLKLTSDVGLIFTGYTKSFGHGGSDMWLLKTAPVSYTMENGATGSSQQEKWNITIGGPNDDAAASVIQSSDGGFAATGYTKSFGSGGSDMYLVKVNAQGTLQWNKTYGGAGDDAANCLIQTYDGGYLLVGYTNSNVNTQTAWVVKTDSSGELQWEKTFAGTAANSVVAKSDGYTFAVEYSDSFGLTTMDSSGNIGMTRTYPAPGAVASTQSVAAVDDGYAIAGWTGQNASGTNDTWLLKVSSSGELRWSRLFSGVGAYNAIRMSNGGYALTGDRAALILTDSAGGTDWCQLYDGNPGNDTEYMEKYPVVMREVIEASPNHFVMVGQQKNSLEGDWQMSWYQVALKSGAQTIPPEVTITSPASTAYTQRDIPLTFYVNERPSAIFYSLNGYLNKTINGNTTLANLPNGQYSVIVYAIDINGNTGASQNLAFTVSSSEAYIAPKVVIESPENGSYISGQGTLHFSVDQQVAWSAYSLDDGPKMLAVPNVDMVLYTSGGNHTLTVYAGQTEESAGSASVTFHTYESYATIFSSIDTNAVLSLLGLSLLFTPIFATIVAAFVIVSVCVIVVAIYLATKTPVKKSDNGR